jgi:hypothetical protein
MSLVLLHNNHTPSVCILADFINIYIYIYIDEIRCYILKTACERICFDFRLNSLLYLSQTVLGP